MVASISIFLGLGGGIFMVPLLPNVFGLSLQSAVATSVCTIALVVTRNTLSFHRRGWVNWALVKWMAPACVLAAFLSARLNSLIPEQWTLSLLLLLLLVMLGRVFMTGLQKQSYKTQPLSLVSRSLLMMGALFA